MQFEVIEQSGADWNTHENNYESVANGNRSSDGNSNSTTINSNHQYIEGFSYPLIGDEVLNYVNFDNMVRVSVCDKPETNTGNAQGGM
jgi:hypothetical protein